MGWLQSLGGVSASFTARLTGGIGRRDLLIAGAGLVVAGCQKTGPLTASRTPRLDMKRLDKEVAGIAARAAPGVLGFGLMNLESGEFWVRLGDRPFPMQSVFKLPLGAAVLGQVDAGLLSLGETLTIRAEDLSPAWSPIADAWPGRAAYTVQELLEAAVGNSDNTAADLLMQRIGGPGVVSAWLQGRNVSEIRIDRYEREIQPAVYGMASFRPAWKGDAAFNSAKATVPPATRHAAMLAYMADPRDSATPEGMLGFLRRLDDGELISPASTARLLTIMSSALRGADRLMAGLPKTARFAHKTGTSGTDQGLNAAFNEVGVFTLADRRSYAICAFLSGATASEAERAALFAQLGHTAAESVG